jgi:conjugal transfer/entry exclusion protein
MFLMTLFSAFCLLTSPALINPSFKILYQNHLETASGRTAFLTDKLALYTKSADQINQEIQALAEKVKKLSPQDDQQQIVSLTEEMTQKMGTLLTMMPVLDAAMFVEKDFQRIDAILSQKDPLSAEQQQVIDRITSLCNSLEKF